MEGNHTIEGGISACAQLLAGPITPTAILCSNDMTALGVMRKSYEEGLSIPRDLSVIGFDDIRLAQFVFPRSRQYKCHSPNWHVWLSMPFSF